MPSGLRRRVLRVYAHHEFLREQITELRSRASCRAAKLAGRQPSSKVRQLMHLQRHWDQWGLGVGHGIFWLARVQESSRGGWLSGLNADTVSQRRECPRTRHHQVGESTRALDDHGVGLELAPLPTGECPAWLVSRALWWRWQAPEAHWDCRGGAEVTHGAVAIPRDRGLTQREPALKEA